MKATTQGLPCLNTIFAQSQPNYYAGMLAQCAVGSVAKFVQPGECQRIGGSPTCLGSTKLPSKPIVLFSTVLALAKSLRSSARSMLS